MLDSDWSMNVLKCEDIFWETLNYEVDPVLSTAL